MLDTPDGDFRCHLTHAAALLADLRPLSVFGYDDAPHGHMEVVLIQLHRLAAGPGRAHRADPAPGRSEEPVRGVCWAAEPANPRWSAPKPRAPEVSSELAQWLMGKRCFRCSV